MKVCVLGAGALGSVIGGALARSGIETWLLTRSAAHVQAVRAHGLKLVDARGEHAVTQIHAATSAADIGPCDLVIVLVKSFDTARAVRNAPALFGENTVALSLQNGLGHEEVLAEVLGPQRVMAGKTYVGGVMLSPGVVSAGIEGKETLIGELDGEASERVRLIAEAFNQAGLLTTVSRNIMGTMWDKLLVNVSTGAIAGITRLTYGPLYQVPEIRRVAIAAVAEAIAVARAKGIELSTTDPEAPWLKASAGLSADFKTSMLQSLEKGSVTEIDFINGAVVRHGAALGIATPYNETLVACIKGIEAGMAR